MTAPADASQRAGRRVVLVTGGSLGIGKEMARAFAERRDLVVLCARGEEALREAAADIGQGGAEVETVICDVGDIASVDEMVGGILERHGRLDVLINNAGIYGPIGSFTENDLDEWIRTVDINLIGLARVTHRVLPFMIEAGGGCIVNLSGGGATGPKPGYSAYGTSKAAVVRLTEILAHELEPHGVRVNAIAPGFVATRLHERTLEAGEAAPDRDKVASLLDEGGQDPRLAADLAVFLASEEAAGVTGRLISAPWDDWRSLAGERTLEGSDLYTLRRIDDMFFKEVPRE